MVWLLWYIPWMRSAITATQYPGAIAFPFHSTCKGCASVPCKGISPFTKPVLTYNPIYYRGISMLVIFCNRTPHIWHSHGVAMCCILLYITTSYLSWLIHSEDVMGRYFHTGEHDKLINIGISRMVRNALSGTSILSLIFFTRGKSPL